jgi:D-serine deaminase-like pyridoxal phosphate-dependent protein
MNSDTAPQSFNHEELFCFPGKENVVTPALLIHRDRVKENVEVTLRLLGGNANRWRPHVKTAKLAYVIRMLVESGVHQCKCSTTLELLAACSAGMRDVLFAYPVVGANAARVREIAAEYSDVTVSVLVENVSQVKQWQGAPIGIFIDINPGMDRTGIEEGHVRTIAEVAKTVAPTGLKLRGLHYYDGHLGTGDLAQRCITACSGYDRLMDILGELSARGIAIDELVTSGTPTFPCAASYQRFASVGCTHRVSPGTIVYSDMNSSNQLPPDFKYQPAAIVMTSVVSHPAPGVFTCDAGHKAVSADAGLPTCAVLGHPEYQPLAPSEEHLPMQVAEGGSLPDIGELLFLVPRHVCPTVNNFSDAIIVSGGRAVAVENVTARGHECPHVLELEDSKL